MTEEIVQVPTNDEKFAIDDVIGNGWQVMKVKFWPLLGIMSVNGLMAALVPLASFVMGTGGSLSMDNLGLQLLLGILGATIALTIELGMMNINLLALEGKKVGPDDCFRCIKYLPSYFVVKFLSLSVIAIGYLCFIIPGIILQISFQFAGYFIVEKKLGPIAALKASWAICDGARWQLVLLAIVCQFISWFGTMCLLVGAIPAYMVNGLALAATYRSLLAHAPELGHLAPPPQLSEEAVAELLKHDSWPAELAAAQPESALNQPESMSASASPVDEQQPTSVSAQSPAKENTGDHQPAGGQTTAEQAGPESPST